MAALGEDTSRWMGLLDMGKARLESELYNGEYFFQMVVWEGMDEKYTPLDVSSNGSGYKAVVDLLNTQGPKYQYGTGCLSDGVLGVWMARACGLGEIADTAKVKSHLSAVYRYNLKHDLSDHSNPQRPRTLGAGRLSSARGRAAARPPCPSSIPTRSGRVSNTRSLRTSCSRAW